MTTRRQHYVWQKYLEAWTTKKGKAQQLWCLRRDGKAPFLSDTANVAVERDFYRLTEYRPEDAQLLRAVRSNSRSHSLLRQLNDQWLMMFEMMFAAVACARESSKATPEIHTILDRELIENQERFLGQIENSAPRL